MSALLIIAALILLLYLGQERLIYYPRRYPPGAAAGSGLEPLLFTLPASGSQTAFYLPPRQEDQDRIPQALWVLFGGNASLALYWRDLAAHYPGSGVAFLLIDYPGYGDCEGTPSPASILAASTGALQALANRLGLAPAALDERLYLLGHSLGAAAALQLTDHHHPQGLFLVSPFTSLSDMAIRVVGFPLNHLLRHHFDNREPLRRLATGPHPPPIAIVHGSRDEVVPVRMGRELAELSPAIRYLEIPGADHNGILDTARSEIYHIMGEMDRTLPQLSDRD